MPPSRNQEQNVQDRRQRRPGPLGQPPQRREARDESTQRQHGYANFEQGVPTQPRGRSSTPRGGRSGPGRGGFSGARGSRGGPHSCRSSGAMSWSQSQPEAAPAFKRATTAWMTRVAAEDGVIATKLTPTGLGGGYSANWYASTPEGYWCQSSTGAGLDKMAKLLMDEEPDAVAVNVIMTPVIPKVFDSIEIRQTQKLEMSNNFCGKDGKPAGLFGREIQAPSEKKPVVQGECELCSSKKHILADCIVKGYKGSVGGCTICNSRAHLIDSCEQFQSMSLTGQVKIVVSQRANRPAIRSSKAWHTYLHEFCMSNEFDARVVTGFPWSKGFCKVKGFNGLKKIQAAYEADPENYVFEVDDKTRNWDMVYVTCWQPANMVRPKVLGGDIKSEGDEGVVKSEPDV
jgi:hypothetical protein